MSSRFIFAPLSTDVAKTLCNAAFSCGWRGIWNTVMSGQRSDFSNIHIVCTFNEPCSLHARGKSSTSAQGAVLQRPSDDEMYVHVSFWNRDPPSVNGYPGAHVHTNADALSGVKRSGLGTFRPQFSTRGSVDSSSIGLFLSFHTKSQFKGPYCISQDGVRSSEPVWKPLCPFVFVWMLHSAPSVSIFWRLGSNQWQTACPLGNIKGSISAP